MLRNVVLAAVLCALPMAALAQADAGGETKTASSGTTAKELSGGSGAAGSISFPGKARKSD